MAVCVTNGNCSTSSGTNWVGGVNPTSVGDQIQIGATGHALNIDSNLTLGYSPGTTYDLRPTVTRIDSTTGSLPNASSYALVLVPVGANGPAHHSPPTTAITIGSSGTQLIRVTLPTLPGGNTSWSIYLNSGTSGSAYRKYATGLSAGTYDCTKATWQDAGGSEVAYASAAALPFAAAIGYAHGVTGHTGGITLAAGVALTLRGDFAHLGTLTLPSSGNGVDIRFDPSLASAGSRYRLWGGWPGQAGAPFLTSDFNDTAAGRHRIRTLTGGDEAQVMTAVVGGAAGASCDYRVDVRGLRLSRMGKPDSYDAWDVFNDNASTNQRVRRVRFDSDCGRVSWRGPIATSGLIEEDVYYGQQDGNTTGGVRHTVRYDFNTNKTTGTRTHTRVTYGLLGKPLIPRGGSTWTDCYFDNGWADTGTATTIYTLVDAVIRRVEGPGAGGGSPPADPYYQDGINCSGNLTRYYLLHDRATVSGGIDYNPHGLGGKAANGTFLEWVDGVYEHNGTDGSGDMNKSPTSTTSLPTGVNVRRPIGVPNPVTGLSPGSLFTIGVGVTGDDFKWRAFHPTWCVGIRTAMTMEAAFVVEDLVPEASDGIWFSVPNTGARYMTGESAVTNFDLVSPEGLVGSVIFNLSDTTGVPDANRYGPCAAPLSADPRGTWVSLGNVSGLAIADLATYGPKFVDPTRNFAKYFEVNHGATGTLADKTNFGRRALMAVSDPYDPYHIPGLLPSQVIAWVRAGFAPRAAELDPAVNPAVNPSATDITTRGAVAWVSSGTAANGLRGGMRSGGGMNRRGVGLLIGGGM